MTNTTHSDGATDPIQRPLEAIARFKATYPPNVSQLHILDLLRLTLTGAINAGSGGVNDDLAKLIPGWLTEVEVRFADDPEPAPDASKAPVVHQATPALMSGALEFGEADLAKSDYFRWKSAPMAQITIKDLQWHGKSAVLLIMPDDRQLQALAVDQLEPVDAGNMIHQGLVQVEIMDSAGKPNLGLQSRFTFFLDLKALQV